MQKFLLGAIVGGLSGLALGAVFAAGSLLAVEGLAAHAGRVVALCGGVAGFVGMFVGGVSGAAFAAGGGQVQACVAAVALAFAGGALAARHVAHTSVGGWQLIDAAGAALAAAIVLVWHGRQHRRSRSGEGAAATAADPRGWRRFAQFRLSTLLALFVMVGALLSTLVSGPVMQARAVAALRRNGGQVSFAVATPSWLSFLLGDTSGKTDLVTSVALDGPNSDDTQLAWLGNLPDVSSVRITSAAVTDAGLVHLRKLKRLESLSLEASAITDAGLQNLSSLHQLEWLDLGGKRITDAGLVHLQRLTRLRYLNLSGTKIGDAGVSHLGGLVTLKALILDNTAVSDAGLAHLAGLTELQILHLNGTKITDAGLKHLLDLPALEYLQAVRTGVTPGGAEVLGDLPSLHYIQASGPRGLVSIDFRSRRAGTVP